MTKKSDVDTDTNTNKSSDELADTARRGTARRRMLKRMAGGGSAAVVTVTFAEQWYKPVVDAVVMPGHAQTSPTGELTGSVEFLSNDVSDTPGAAGPFSCGATENIEVGDADWTEISLTGIAANVAPAGTTVALEVNGNAVDTGGANQTSQSLPSDPTNGDVSFADVLFDGAGADDSDVFPNDDFDPTGHNTIFTFSAPGASDCVIQINFTESVSAF